MSPHMSRVAPLLLGAACLLTQAVSASAQWFPSNNSCCNNCCCCPAPVCAQPVSVPCYQTVPVTEMQSVRQTVMKPVYKTAMIEQPVTEYRPVTETRTAQIPTCTYQPVTEYIPNTRDCGCWHTSCQCCPKMSPCQYDPNPGLMGWMNRSSYSMRMAFTPNVTYRRQWVPNYVTTMVPITRQVAQHSVREVSYNVTTMVAHQTKRQVAVNHVEYETAEIVTQRPVTVMKTVPIGTSVAWLPFGATATAALPGSLAATPDRISNNRAYHKGEKKGYEEATRQFKREEREEKMEAADPSLDNKRTELIVPQRKGGDPTAQQPAARRIPSVAQLNGWHKRTTLSESQDKSPGVSIVDSRQ